VEVDVDVEVEVEVEVDRRSPNASKRGVWPSTSNIRLANAIVIVASVIVVRVIISRCK
jgi:hypothetical protein